MRPREHSSASPEPRLCRLSFICPPFSSASERDHHVAHGSSLARLSAFWSRAHQKDYARKGWTVWGSSDGCWRSNGGRPLYQSRKLKKQRRKRLLLPRLSRTCLLVGLVISQPVLMTALLLGLRRRWPCLRNHPSRNGCHSLFRIGYFKRNI